MQKKLYTTLFQLLLTLLSLNAYGQQNPFKAPLYWSVYEHHIVKEQNGVKDNYIPESEWQANIDWVEQNLKPYGYNMICIDGWGDDSKFNEYGYRTSHSWHWEHDYAWWSQHLQGRGMTLGMYGNPLWINKGAAAAGVKIKGTDIPLSSLINEEENALWFTWVQVDWPGAEEYVKGYVQHYADMGIKYFRVDFLSWFEDGYDKNLGRVGANRPREHYETALRWMREAAEANGMFLSLVMPHLKNEAELELQYGNMIRINEDVAEGGWHRFSEAERGIRRNYWSQYYNTFDGFIYWSQVAGRNKMILDGDFIRLNTMANKEEKKTVISLHLMAGGPLTPADQHNTIGNDLWLYQNREMLALNEDGFVGKPLSNDPTKEESQVWTGQMANGDWIIGLFNREDTVKTRSISFSDLGFSGPAQVRDLWAHADLGAMESVAAQVPPHGCIILRLSTGESACQSQSITFNSVPDKTYDAAQASFTLEATASSGLPVRYEITAGPATVEGSNLTLNGRSGTVTVVARQAGDVTYCAALQQAVSFQITGLSERMYIGGTFNNWTLDSTPMSLTDGLWTDTGVQLSAGNHQLKFANTNNWSGDDWGDASGLTGTARLSTGGKPNISFTIAESGKYTFTFNDVTLEYAICKDIVASVSSREEALSNVQVYPNPVNDMLHIKLTEAAASVSVVNAIGVVVITKQQRGNVFSIDTSSLPPGLYFVRVLREDKTSVVRKIIISR
jgi:hypothetical protein